MSLERVLDIAVGELGYTETPPNRTKYWEAYDPKMQGQPWCVAFLWWCFERAGERMAFFGGGKTASCTTLLRWYKEQGLIYMPSEVEVGDIVIFNFRGGETPEHCGIVVEITPAGIIKTIEGNTSPGEEGSQDNGGCVALKRRYAYQMIACCRPEYKAEEDDMITDKKPDYAGHWAEKDIIWAKERGIMEGYPDGTFRPDQPVTRAELAVILHRLEATK
jgi:hypothetical protein